MTLLSQRTADSLSAIGVDTKVYTDSLSQTVVYLPDCLYIVT